MTTTVSATEITSQLLLDMVDESYQTGDNTVLVQNHDLTFSFVAVAEADPTLLWLVDTDEIEGNFGYGPTRAQLDDLAARINSSLAEMDA